jgi:hypothetical protein
LAWTGTGSDFCVVVVVFLCFLRFLLFLTLRAGRRGNRKYRGERRRKIACLRDYRFLFNARGLTVSFASDGFQKEREKEGAVKMSYVEQEVFRVYQTGCLPGYQSKCGGYQEDSLLSGVVVISWSLVSVYVTIALSLSISMHTYVA